MSFHKLNQFLLTNLIKLKSLKLDIQTPINSEILLKLLEYFPYIEILHLHGKLSYFNLDSLSNLKRLDLTGTIMDDYNVHLFDNLCNQLEYITISCSNFDYKHLEKLFYGRNFPYLSTLYITDSLAKIKLEKKLFDGLGNLQKVIISQNKHAQIVDIDMFSNLMELKHLWLSDTCIEFIDKTMLSNLNNLEYLELFCNRLKSLSAKSFVGLGKLKRLDLSNNQLANFDLDIFDNIGKIVEIHLFNNPINNKDEILNRSLQSNINVYI